MSFVGFVPSGVDFFPDIKSRDRQVLSECFWRTSLLHSLLVLFSQRFVESKASGGTRARAEVSGWIPGFLSQIGRMRKRSYSIYRSSFVPQQPCPLKQPADLDRLPVAFSCSQALLFSAVTHPLFILLLIIIIAGVASSDRTQNPLGPGLKLSTAPINSSLCV